MNLDGTACPMSGPLACRLWVEAMYPTSNLAQKSKWMKYRNFGIERDGKMALTTLLKIENKIKILLENPNGLWQRPD